MLHSFVIKQRIIYFNESSLIKVIRMLFEFVCVCVCDTFDIQAGILLRVFLLSKSRSRSIIYPAVLTLGFESSVL